MGFLKVFGRPLDWEESKQYINKIRNSAVECIIDWIVESKQKKCCPKFGYEIEIHKIYVDQQNKKVTLDLSGQEDIMHFKEKEEALKESKENDQGQLEFTIQFEYGRWMIECVPVQPLNFCEFHLFEKSMNNMWDFSHEHVGKYNALFISSFPMLGAGKEFFKVPEYIIKQDQKKLDTNSNTSNGLNTNSNNPDADADAENSKEGEHSQYSSNDSGEEYKPPSLDYLFTNPYSNSSYSNDVVINSHPRFGTLTRNIRSRRGSKVEIKIPIYMDTNTMSNNSDSEPFPGYIHMDAMAFGMGSCCFQATIGTCSLNSTCFLYDQLIPVAPILLALSSSGPIYKGKLAGYDNRFDVISQAVDDRTEEERNPLSNKYIYKSRYSPCYSYISENIYVQEYHNDYPKMPVNEEYLKRMIENGIPNRLSTHFCNLLVRDPLVIFDKRIDIEDKSDRTHFENFNSTNWNSLRFKPPRPEDGDSCFKVEFRPLDLQLTPFENTALLSLVLALYASVFSYDVNFVIPITLVDENFKRAYLKDAVTDQKFFWRVNGIDKTFKNISSDLCKRKFLSPRDNMVIPSKEEDMANIKELTIKEILLGSEEYDYPGIIKLCQEAIMLKFHDESYRSYLNKFLDFVVKRATGELWTDAKYIRNFVLEHPKYMKDSIVNDEINYDLIQHLLKIQNKEISPQELFGDIFI